MRSFTYTLLLLLVTVAVSLTAALRLSQGSLEKLFGAPATGVGEYLYKFDTKDIRRFVLSGNGVRAEAVFKDGIWHLKKPWDDRMDPRAAAAIRQFTIGTRVEDIIPEGKIDTAKADLREGTIGIQITDQDGEEMARYLLGRKTEWIHRDEESGEEFPTVFIQPLDDGREGFIYACTGDIHPIFKDGFRHLRDHHPFLFNPFGLESIRIQGSDSNLVMARFDAQAPWRIVQPLELRTDPEAVKKLIEDLFKLRAVKVSDRSEVTLPADDTNGRQKIAIRHFGQEEEVVLEIYPPATPEADTVLATVSDRPGTVFELRLKPLGPGVAEDGSPAAEGSGDEVVSLAGLPDTVNELRNPMLTNIDVESLQGILISPATSEEILVAREKGQAWQYRHNGRMEPINEIAIYRLLKAMTQTKVAEFVSDAAVNLEPYGLDRPSLSLRFASFGNEGFEIVFGQSREGIWYAMRVGVPTVMRLDDEFIFEIFTRSWQWRHPGVWSIPAIDLIGFERDMEGRPPLVLEYDFLTETWKAREGGVDRGPELVTDRANRLLKLLLDIQCDTWLAPDDPDALAALAKPVLRFKLAVKAYDKNAMFTGIEERELVLAPGSDSATNVIFYGRIGNDPHAFLLGPETVRRLAVDLFGDD
ncbi:DUF4340 domain-containing protein [Luteolibacter marinus]|uniref:DUF4340 domain-containing protein n=1 Tax=Luteolibacter marinus TaxID=2776705 RepID=UPI0018671845|nr:DUF4340 domain-containing protein [Luteolibacter marinus]